MRAVIVSLGTRVARGGQTIPVPEARVQVDTVCSPTAGQQRNMDRHAIRRQGMQVIVSLDRLFKSDQNGAEWAAAVVTF